MFFAKLLKCDSTAEWARQIIAQMHPYPYLADVVVILLALLIGSIVSTIAYFILQHFLLRVYKRCCEQSDELLLCVRNMSFSIVTCLPLYTIAYCTWVDGVHEWVAHWTRELMQGFIVLSIASALSYAIRSFGIWYKQQKNSSQRPIDGLLRVAVSFVWMAAVILFFSVVLNRSPFYLLSGLGAMAAVLLLVFQPSILSLVASVRVNTNHLVEIGDWIVLDADGVDGKVEEITLHTVKVRNWDRSLVSMPVCDLVNKPFVNYTAMEKGGGRRIRMSLLLDQRSIRFLTKEEVKELKGFDLIKEYLRGKEEEISIYNSSRSHFNTRHLTNLGTFRVYAQHYLEHSSSIRDDLMLLVRVQTPTASGIPLEIYCFTKAVSWLPHERVKSAIIEHLLAVLPNFHLRVFQECSDIYQEVSEQSGVVGGVFRFDRFKAPSQSDADEPTQA